MGHSLLVSEEENKKAQETEEEEVQEMEQIDVNSAELLDIQANLLSRVRDNHDVEVLISENTNAESFTSGSVLWQENILNQLLEVNEIYGTNDTMQF